MSYSSVYMIIALILQLRRRLRVDTLALGSHSTDLQRAKIIERNNALKRRIEAWCGVQALYMPGVVALRAAADYEGGGDVVAASNLELLLPSQVLGRVKCPSNLVEYEYRLRYAQAHDILYELRRHLLLRTQLYRSKDQHVMGQRLLTRSVKVLETMQTRIKTDIERYQKTREAVRVLAGALLLVGWDKTLRPLHMEDATSLDLSIAQGSSKGISEGQRTLSWIWSIEGVESTVDENGMHSGLSSPCLDVLVLMDRVPYDSAQA